MGEKGSKKDKEKSKKQISKKHEQQVKKAQDKQPKKNHSIERGGGGLGGGDFSPGGSAHQCGEGTSA